MREGYSNERPLTIGLSDVERNPDPTRLTRRRFCGTGSIDRLPHCKCIIFLEFTPGVQLNACNFPHRYLLIPANHAETLSIDAGGTNHATGLPADF